MNNEMQRVSILKQIISMLDKESRMVDSDCIQQGQFVIAALILPDNALWRVGYITQIRRKVGQFGSDKVFMRLADESLIVHENQAFWRMTSDQEALARQVFTQLPEKEDYSLGYNCTDKIHEVGFIIENSKSVPSPVENTVNLTISTKDSIEMISFIR
ncbi:hypothetical protein ACQWTT_001177 [Acinetobacter baumannii]